MSHNEDIIKYCTDITKNKILSGEYTKKAVKRFLSDLKREKQSGFDYEYKQEYVDEIIDFAETLQIPDIQAEDKSLKLLPWMKFIYANLFGWRHKTDNEKRRFRAAYCEVARKNSKTTSLLFPIIIYDFLTTDAAESYFVAKDQAQSYKSFKEMLYIIKSNPELKNVINETVSAITYQNSRIAFFSSESVGIDSYKNSLSVIDEFHSYDNDKVVTAFRYGGRARKNNLVLIITSAGNDISGPCYDENEKCKKVLNDIVSDETYFGIIYAYDDGDVWNDPKNYIKANPSLGTFLLKEVLNIDLKDAETTPSHQPDFKSKTCGIWTDAYSTWLPIQKWQANKNVKMNEDDLIGRIAYGALDLSSISDFTAYTLTFDIEGRQYFKHRFYIPETTVQDRIKKENINILGWIQQGYLTVVPGETVDYEYVYNDILNDSKIYNIKEIAYDRWQANFLIQKLNENIPNTSYIEFDQGLKKMSPATKQYEKAVLDKSIIDNNPIMLWMIQNVQVKMDANGNYKPLKINKGSVKKIDGVVTSIMAYALAKEHTENNKETDFAQLLASL